MGKIDFKSMQYYAFQHTRSAGQTVDVPPWSLNAVESQSDLNQTCAEIIAGRFYLADGRGGARMPLRLIANGHVDSARTEREGSGGSRGGRGFSVGLRAPFASAHLGFISSL